MKPVNTPHILLIDDNLDDLAPLVTCLKSANMRVSLASVARKGYHLALALKPDLIVLDLYMPGMDGFSICRLLREEPKLNRTPIIFLSSTRQLDDRLTGLQLGSVDFVTKPYAAEEVLARIRIHLRLSSLQTAPEVHAADAIEPNDAQPHVDCDELLIRAATRLILENLAEPPSLDDLAKSVGTNQKRLLGVFRQRHGMTVFAYIRELRLQQAKHLLRGTQLPIDDIAASVGFSNSANFATAFKSHEGIPPREYRKSFQP
ncbi:response regulator transcription factor [Halopseudomonas salegens]|uniref:Response regulator receiver domain-containing protein n=1 Tax=Halopseudomonas salegens TaxID=1434072 RepID=A0A1H2EPK4_9GAMM|nr:DNA-binding response regulator [Halopseudomonas salegens]SDT96678.1 Response regulator receiver domain-containing protein [Halopseudomonas salegens]